MCLVLVSKMRCHSQRGKIIRLTQSTPKLELRSPMSAQRPARKRWASRKKEGRMQTYHVLQQNKCYPLIVEGDTRWVGGMRIR
jgi:hypothetical protein